MPSAAFAKRDPNDYVDLYDLYGGPTTKAAVISVAILGGVLGAILLTRSSKKGQKTDRPDGNADKSTVGSLGSAYSPWRPVPPWIQAGIDKHLAIGQVSTAVTAAEQNNQTAGANDSSKSSHKKAGIALGLAGLGLTVASPFVSENRGTDVYRFCTPDTGIGSSSSPSECRSGTVQGAEGLTAAQGVMMGAGVGVMIRGLVVAGN